MEMSLAEGLVILAATWGLFRLLSPVQRRLEDWLGRFLNPTRPRVIDVTPAKKRKE